MSTMAARSSPVDRVGFRWLATSWLVALAGSLVANLVIYVVARALLNPPAKFMPLATPLWLVVFTVLGTIGAALTFGLVLRLARASLGVFRWATAGLVFVLALLADTIGTGLTSPIWLLAAGVVAAVLVVLLAPRLHEDPVRGFQVIGGIMLLVSLLPPLALLVGPSASQVADQWAATPPLVIALMVMHVVTAVITIGLLTIPILRNSAVANQG